MVLADIIDYAPAKVYRQKGLTCVAHAFFTAVAEEIQQSFGETVEFDIYKYHDEMLKWRDADAQGGYKKNYIRCYFTMAKQDGFKTKDGRLVKVGRSKRLFKKDHDKICWELQFHGPLLLAVKRYEEHSLNPRGGVIGPVPENATPRKVGHQIVIRGFDRPNQAYKIHDSKGPRYSVNWMPFDVYDDIMRHTYSFWNVTLK